MTKMKWRKHVIGLKLWLALYILYIISLLCMRHF